MAFEAPANARPYLVAVPPELDAFEALLRALGVRQAFAPRDFALALRGLASSQAQAGGLQSALDADQVKGVLSSGVVYTFRARVFFSSLISWIVPGMFSPAFPLSLSL